MGVLSDISGFSNPFGASSNGEWNLLSGIYVSSQGDVFTFFIEDRKKENKQSMTALENIADTGGRRLAIYEYPYIDGQRVEDLGRKGETYTFNIKFHGSQYQELLNQFQEIVVNDNGRGILLHPTLSTTRGSIPVRFKDYEIVHRYDEWSAVTIKVSFVEDNTSAINITESDPPAVDSTLRSALQTLTDAQAFIGNTLFEVGALLNLPNSIINAMKQRLTSITGQVSRLIGQVSATFSPTSSTSSISAQSKQLGISTTNLNSGTNSLGVLPPVFQSGYSPATQASINAQQSNFINSNQVTTQQAVFAGNVSRKAISDAINEINSTMGNSGYDMVLSYRGIANSIQEMIEVAISSSKSQVKSYTVPSTMSLRQIAKNNNLSADRQNDIESLNPYLPSVNFIPAGSKVLVPVS